MLEELGLPAGPPDYLPMEHVTVIAYGFNCKGRIISSQLHRGGWVYETEFRHEDEVRTRNFYADELRKAG